MGTIRGPASVVALVLFTAACSNDSPARERSDTSDTIAGAPTTDTDVAVAPTDRELAGTDLSQHAVPLDEIVFDTFDGGSIRLDEASEEEVLALRDVIIPIDDPLHVDGATEPLDELPLEPDELVLGYVADDGSAFAYPHRVMFVHEIVNETLSGRPVLITYCPLCNSGVVFDRRIDDGTELTFGNTSALHENDLVMYDHQTLSYWWQVAGRGIVGELTGTELTALPSTTTSWAEWMELHPDTRVLALDQGFGRDYVRRSADAVARMVDAGRPPFWFAYLASFPSATVWSH